MIRSETASIASRRYRTKLRDHNGFPYCVALLDLLFLLLLFVAMSTQVIRISGIKVDLPQADAPQESVLGKLIVTITPGEYENDCRYYFRDREIKLDGLRQIFSQQTERNKKTVIIRSDRKVPAGVLHELISSIHEANMSVLIAVQPPDARPEMHFE
ncbi:MAG: biopolymer transporter ExbD [Lentisphaeria bacterium]|nr:biopolymer transporter ExbD [Lentisphaeria bacterium]